MSAFSQSWIAFHLRGTLSNMSKKEKKIISTQYFAEIWYSFTRNIFSAFFWFSLLSSSSFYPICFIVVNIISIYLNERGVEGDVRLTYFVSILLIFISILFFTSQSIIFNLYLPNLKELTAAIILLFVPLSSECDYLFKPLYKFNFQQKNVYIYEYT